MNALHRSLAPPPSFDITFDADIPLTAMRSSSGMLKNQLPVKVNQLFQATTSSIDIGVPPAVHPQQTQPFPRKIPGISP